jgi:hypothetical protein
VLTLDAVDRSLDLVADMETLDRASVLADTLKRFPTDLNRRDSQRDTDERFFVH